METFTLKEIAAALGYTQARIEQWVSRKYVVPSSEHAMGRRGRGWTAEDAYRLKLCEVIVSSPVRPDDYHRAIEDAAKAKDGYFLVEISPGKPESWTGMTGLEWEAWKPDGGTTWRIVSASELAELVLSGFQARKLTVINLGALASETTERLAFFRRTGGEVPSPLNRSEDAEGRK